MRSHRGWDRFGWLRLALPATVTALLFTAGWWLLLGGAAPARAEAPLRPLNSAPSSNAGGQLGAGVVAGEVFTAALPNDVEGFDPAIQVDGATLLVAAQIYDTLVRYAADGAAPEAGLAQSWSLSANGLTWTFDLRPGVKFHDGSDLDAQAVVDNINRWWDPADPLHQGEFTYFAAIFGGFKGEPACILSAVRASGPLQVQLAFSRRYSELPSVLGLAAFGIASPQALRGGALNTAPIGSGPYRFVQHSGGRQVQLAANPDYWGDPPHIPNLVFFVIAEDAERLAALRSSTVHAADIMSPTLAAQLADPALKLLWRPALAVGYLGINRAHGPLGSQLVREAIAHAINRPALIDQHYPFGSQAADQFLPSTLWGSDPTLRSYAYDPDLARRLLAQAGYAGGFTTTLAYRTVVRSYLPNPVETAAAIRADLLAVGIDAQLTPMESNLFLDKVYSGELDLFLLGWGSDYPHPQNFLGGVLCAGDKAFGEPDAVLCNQLAAAQAEMDFAGQLAGYRAASRRVHETLPLLPLVHPRSAMGTRANVVLQPSPVAEQYRSAFFAEIWALQASKPFTATTAAGGVTTTLQVRAGAVASDTLLVQTPAPPSPLQPLPPLFVFTGHAFTLQAFQGSRPVNLAPTTPITLEIDYDGLELPAMNAATISLYSWGGAAWNSDGIALIARDVARRRLTVTVTQSGHFALLGQSIYWLYAPVVVR